MTNTNEKIPGRVLMAVIATGLLSFSGVIVETAMNVSFPTLMRDFNVDTNVVQWMTSLYLLVVAIMVPLSAYFKHNFSTRRLFLVANLFFIAGLVIDTVAPNFAILLLGRFVQGLGTGISLPLMFNIIIDQVPKSKLGLMMGVGNLITGIAPAIGPTFGGLVVTGLVTGFANLATMKFLSLAVGGAFAIGLVGLAGLTWRSLNLTDPLLDLRLFSNYRFGRVVTMFFLTQLCSLGFAFLLPNYIQLVGGQTALLAGLVVLPAGVAGAIGAPFGGRLLDQVGPLRPVLTGNCLMLFSAVLFILSGNQLNATLICGIYIFYMAGMGMTMGCLMTSALGFLRSDQRAQGNAIINTCQQFAGAMGTSLASMVVEAGQKQAGQVAGTQLGSHRVFLLILVTIAIILVMGLATLPNRRLVAAK